MATEFQKGEYVVYDNAGVCCIADITKMKFSYERVERLYYILRPINNQASTVYVPVDNEKQVQKMRYVFTKEEIDKILYSTKDECLVWNEDKKQRSEEFKKILSEKDQRQMLLLASCIYLKREELIEKGKKLSNADEQVLKEAERFINEEFAFSLQLSEGDTAQYIQSKLI